MLAGERGRPGTARKPLVALDAHTVGRRQTGNERYVLEVARALTKRDDVDLVAYVDRGVAWPADYSPAPRVAELHARAPQLRIPLELPVRARRDRADLLQVTYVKPPVAGLPVVTVVHDLSFEDQPDVFSMRTRLRLKLFVRLAARSSAAVVTISEFTRQRLIETYGLPPERVHFLAPGVGEQWRPPTADEVSSIRARFSLPARFALAVGAAHPRKNLPRVVDAVGRLRSTTHPDLMLVVCGPTAG
jgi:glycosyltransferase involved in cell wall biosynthesis